MKYFIIGFIFLFHFPIYSQEMKDSIVANYANREVLMFEKDGKSLTAQSIKNIEFVINKFKTDRKEITRIKLIPVVCEINYPLGMNKYFKQMKEIKKIFNKQFAIGSKWIKCIKDTNYIKNELIKPCEYEYIKVAYITKPK